MFQSGSEGRTAQQCAVLTRLLSPLIFNVAMSVLDEHLHRPWKPGGSMATSHQRSRRRAQGRPNWRTIRYADDFVVLVHGTGADAETLREEIADVLAPLGLRLSPAKTRIVRAPRAQRERLGL